MINCNNPPEVPEEEKKDGSPGHGLPINFNYLSSSSKLIISGLELCVAESVPINALSLSANIWRIALITSDLNTRTVSRCNATPQDYCSLSMSDASIATLQNFVSRSLLAPGIFLRCLDQSSFLFKLTVLYINVYIMS